MELTVVIPTFNRRKVLEQTLRRLAEQQTDTPYEVIVVDDGSTDDTAPFAESLAAELPIPVRVLSQQNSGPASARNKGAALAAGKVLLFLGDDIWARPDLLERHLAFHRSRPDDRTALLGRVVWAPEASPSPFMEWLGTTGLLFAYESIAEPSAVRANMFYTGNVSLKTSFFRSQDGFDEAFADAALEDTELGLRLAAAGMTLVYDADAIGEHYHPLDLADTLRRLSKIGKSARILEARSPGWTWFPTWQDPSRRGPLTLAKEALLTAFHAVGFRPARIRHSTWWLLCQQSFQSGYTTGVAETRTDFIGERLRRYAGRDRATRIDSRSRLGEMG